MKNLARLNKDDIVPVGVMGWGISMEMGSVQKVKQNEYIMKMLVVNIGVRKT
jgi:hypothetical protein